MKQITLATMDGAQFAAWNLFFGDVENVKVVHQSLFVFPADVIVSPGNSFGFMDGGLDYLLTSVLGEHVQTEVQRVIKEQFNGELLVGEAIAVKTQHEIWPHLIAAPTMRVPMVLPFDTVNPYLAARAVFRTFHSAPTVQTMVMSALGTGVGRVSPYVCAAQMRKAYDDVFVGSSFPTSWHDAQTRHQLLYTSETRDLQK